jgi:rRNA small subunit pseudouridine methyltransferase Nep1
MRNLSQNRKRGRPDIVHFSLLEALNSPLNKVGLLKIYVHTIANHVISINPKVRLPKNYNRFVGLLEQLFEFGRVPRTGSPLLKITKKTFSELLQEIKPSYIIAFSRIGIPCILEKAIKKIAFLENPAIVVGGFPHGHFSERTMKELKDIYSIDSEMLEGWTLTSRAIYDYERAISLPIKRITSKNKPKK